LYSGQLGYEITYSPTTSLTINPAALTITANDASKIYDGLAWTGGNGVTYSGFVNGEDYNVLSGTLTWSGSSQGAVNAGVYSLIASGLSSGNYVITYQDGTLNIAKANAVITANSGTLTYNGLLQAITGYSITGLVNGENASVITGLVETGGSGTNAGIYAHTVSGGSAANYTLTYVPGALTINPATLTITANDASKTYDGLAWTGGNGVSYSGFVNGEDFNVLSGTLTWGGSSQNAVNAGIYSLIASGLSSGNYVITYKDGTLNIAKANAVITANSGTLTYNGLLQAITGYSITGLVPGDATSVITGLVETGGSGTNAGTYAHTVSGGSAANYNLTYVDGSLLINPAAITLTTSDITKTYDGTTTADGALLLADGQLFGNDSLSGGSFAFTDKNAGTNKTVTVGGVTVNDGNNGGNYVITYLNNTHSTILQKVLTIDGSFNVADKLFDGTTDAEITDSTLALAGIVANDNVGTHWSAAFTSADIGHLKQVVLNEMALTGNDRLNYRIDWANAPTATASIFNSAADTYGATYAAAANSANTQVKDTVARQAHTAPDIAVLQCGQHLPVQLIQDCR
ncbi:MAG: hypothetical protein KUL77_11840, partial [Thermomonas sp.]|uniref:MBG domain-containing protein n=1 Tax=Thermomonas sp. TaxID=1971895 RepID=UPI001ECBA362